MEMNIAYILHKEKALSLSIYRNPWTKTGKICYYETVTTNCWL